MFSDLLKLFPRRHHTVYFKANKTADLPNELNQCIEWPCLARKMYCIGKKVEKIWTSQIYF